MTSEQYLPPGPWDQEPNHVEFEHAGVPCILHRNALGAWCGYAAVEPGHPWHGLDYDLVDGLVDIHGGLTYSDACRADICHVPKPGEPDNVWWLGFDCAHYYDVVPGLTRPAIEHVIGRQLPPLLRMMDLGEYRDLAYVRGETERLAEQIVAQRRSELS